MCECLQKSPNQRQGYGRWQVVSVGFGGPASAAPPSGDRHVDSPLGNQPFSTVHGHDAAVGQGCSSPSAKGLAV